MTKHLDLRLHSEFIPFIFCCLECGLNRVNIMRGATPLGCLIYIYIYIYRPPQWLIGVSNESH